MRKKSWEIIDLVIWEEVILFWYTISLLIIVNNIVSNISKHFILIFILIFSINEIYYNISIKIYLWQGFRQGSPRMTKCTGLRHFGVVQGPSRR